MDCSLASQNQIVEVTSQGECARCITFLRTELKMKQALHNARPAQSPESSMDYLKNSISPMSVMVQSLYCIENTG